MPTSHAIELSEKTKILCERCRDITPKKMKSIVSNILIPYTERKFDLFDFYINHLIEDLSHNMEIRDFEHVQLTLNELKRVCKQWMGLRN